MSKMSQLAADLHERNGCSEPCPDDYAEADAPFVVYRIGPRVVAVETRRPLTADLLEAIREFTQTLTVEA